MSNGQALNLLAFWLDEQADWWKPAQLAYALNRAMQEWVMDNYRQVDQTESKRAEFALLQPPPLQGRGSRIVFNQADGVWLVMSVMVVNPSGKLVRVKPITADQEAFVQDSVFWNPSVAEPMYISEGEGSNRVLRFIPAETMQYQMNYIRKPKDVFSSRPNESWGPFPLWVEEAIIQRAKAMLLQQKEQDYNAQVQIERTS